MVDSPSSYCRNTTACKPLHFGSKENKITSTVPVQVASKDCVVLHEEGGAGAGQAGQLASPDVKLAIFFKFLLITLGQQLLCLAIRFKVNQMCVGVGVGVGVWVCRVTVHGSFRLPSIGHSRNTPLYAHPHIIRSTIQHVHNT